MALPAKRKLGDLRQRLQARLGFANVGELTTLQRTTLNDFLQDAQEQLYWHYDFPELWRVSELTVVGRNADDISFTAPDTIASVSTDLSDFGSAGEVRVTTGSGTNDGTYTVTASDATSITLSEQTITTESAATAGTVRLVRRHYIWPDAVEPRRLSGVFIFRDEWWHRLEQGVEWYHDSVADDPPSWPRRFDVRDTLEIWPDPEQSYPLRIESYQRLGEFSEDKHVATLDDRLVFLHALAAAKAHYRQQDAEPIAAQAASYLQRMRGFAHVDRRYVRGPHNRPDYVPPKPKMV